MPSTFLKSHNDIWSYCKVIDGCQILNYSNWLNISISVHTARKGSRLFILQFQLQFTIKYGHITFCEMRKIGDQFFSRKLDLNFSQISQSHKFVLPGKKWLPDFKLHHWSNYQCYCSHRARGFKMLYTTILFLIFNTREKWRPIFLEKTWRPHFLKSRNVIWLFSCDPLQTIYCIGANLNVSNVWPLCNKLTIMKNQEGVITRRQPVHFAPF